MLMAFYTGLYPEARLRLALPWDSYRNITDLLAVPMLNLSLHPQAPLPLEL